MGRSYPPGFLPVAHDQKDGIIGLFPARDGKGEWVALQKGQGRIEEHLDTIWGRLPENAPPGVPTGAEWKAIPKDLMWSIPVAASWKDVQRDWLQSMRIRAHGAEFLQSIGVSRRTWEGWEQGRPIPYFQASRIAFQFWEERKKKENASRLLEGNNR